MNTALLKNNPPVESKTMRTQERDIESQNNITENVPNKDSERKPNLLVPLKGNYARIGDFADVLITDASEYDLIGVIKPLN